MVGQKANRPRSALSGLVAVVTGGASGIGRAIAERLTADGATVVVVDRAPAVGERGDRQFITADLARPDQCAASIERARAACGPISILVNNAGFQHVSPLVGFPLDRWQGMLDVMLTAPFLLTQAVWPDMAKSGWGRIVNIASIHALVASPHKAAYVAAKHGLLGLTRVAALEGGELGITVNAVCPAYVRTPMVDAQVASQAAATGLAQGEIIDRIMLGPAAVKRLIEPEEVAGLVAYLCSTAAATITGAAIAMDLGWTAR
jgi:3-hydroxybutyrate dehydrogenase